MPHAARRGGAGVSPVRVALIGGAAALAGAAATSSLTNTTVEPQTAATARETLWSTPTIPRVTAVSRLAPDRPSWWPRKSTAVLQQEGTGLAAADASGSGSLDRVAVQRFVLEVPLNDLTLLGDAPVTVTIAYGLTREAGWADARIDVQPLGAHRRFDVVGAQDGGGTMTLLLPADAVRAAGKVSLAVLLRVRVLGGGRAKLVLRSISLAGG